MAINATNNGVKREPIPAGNYVARCYQMVHIGTVKDVINGKTQILNKVRIGWELPTELKVFKEENGEQPYVISKEYTLSLNEKANLRKMLASWRGKDFSDDEAKCFDVTKLIGAVCLINVIHKHGVKDPSQIYEEIGSVSPVPKGMTVPKPITEMVLWDYDNPDWKVYEKLPDFIKDKMKTSLEFAALKQPNHKQIDDDQNHDGDAGEDQNGDDLPF